MVARIDERPVVELGSLKEPAGASEQPTQGFVQILDRSNDYSLVTVIEFLCESDKLPGKGRELYRRRQQEVREASRSLVEINLLRAGEWVLQVSASSIPRNSRTPYGVCTGRGWMSAKFEYYPITLNERLPTIPVPLRQQDKYATLNLQALIDQAYQNGAYDFIDYTKPAVPPLEGEAAAWADQVLRAARKR
jgi:hypothetical protein